VSAHRVHIPFNHILPSRHTNNRHTGYLPHPPLQIAIIGRDQINPLLHHAIHDTVVRIRALVIALQPLPTLVPRNLQRDAVLGSQLLQLGHDAARDDGLAGGIEGVHEGGQEREFVVDGVGEEVGVDEDLVGGLEGGIVLEEHG